MFDHRRQRLSSPGMPQLDRRQLLKATGAAGLAAGLPAARHVSAQDQVTIQYKTHDHPPAVELNKTLVAEFMEANPDIKVEYEGIPYPSFEQGLFTSFAGGDGWDVFWAGDWLTPQFFENDILAPVDFSAYGVSDTGRLSRSLRSAGRSTHMSTTRTSTRAASLSTTPSASSTTPTISPRRGSTRSPKPSR